MAPREALEHGMKILGPFMAAHGFSASPIEVHHGSGGESASASFTRDDRRLELHFRGSLGLVTYRIGSHEASHPAYMRRLGRAGEAAYPGFSTDPVTPFEHLKSDLQQFAADFLSGDGSLLVFATADEAQLREHEQKRSMIAAVGDGRLRRDARQAFRAHDYNAVVHLLSQLRYPDDLSEAERRMFALARERC